MSVRGSKAVSMLTSVGYKEVVLVPPRARGKVAKVLIRGCPVGVPPEELCRDPRVIWLRRRFARGKPQPQLVALVRGAAPPTLKMVCYGDRKVTPYTEDPQLCFQCARWGHVARNCRNAPRCRFCSRFHDSSECVARLKEGHKILPKCPNCGGKHNAGAWGCPRRPRGGPPPSAPGRGPPPPPPGGTELVPVRGNAWVARAAARAASGGASPGGVVDPPPGGVSSTPQDASGPRRRRGRRRGDTDDGPRGAGPEAVPRLTKSGGPPVHVAAEADDLRVQLAEARQVIAGAQQVIQDNQRALLETQQALRCALAPSSAPRREGPGGAQQMAENDGLLARQAADIADLQSRLAESDRVLAETRQELRDSRQALAEMQQALREAEDAPCVPREGAAPCPLSLVALVEDFIERQPLTDSRHQLVTMVNVVLSKYGAMFDDPP